MRVPRCAPAAAKRGGFRFSPTFSTLPGSWLQKSETRASPEMNENLERLLWQRADGELSAEDGKELDRLLADGSLPADVDRELESFSRLLSRARFEEEEVPPSFGPRVLDLVRARAAA